MDMTIYSVPSALFARGLPDRVDEVRALLALAPRSNQASWSGHDLRLWIRLVEQVTNVEIECALTLATAWGAAPGQEVAVAAHIVLVRIAPDTTGLDASRLRRNIESVCSHLRSRMPGDLARRLPGSRARSRSCRARSCGPTSSPASRCCSSPSPSPADPPAGQHR